MNYREEKNYSTEYKQSYLDSINALIDDRQKMYDNLRFSYAKNIIQNPEGARKAFLNMLGWPLNETVKDPISIEKKLLSKEDDYNIYRMKFEIFKNFYFYGLFFEYQDKKLPLVISQHGGLGTPELCSGIYDDTANYNNMSQRILQQGVHVFAPQLLIWDPDTYGVSFDRREIDSKLKQLNSSIAALEIYCIMSSINYFEKLPAVNNSIGMVGLSYGGFYTLFTMAADLRIKAALSSAFYNNRYKYSWHDFTWKNSAEKFLDSEIALLCYPRKLWLSVGNTDDLFDINSAKSERDRLYNELKSYNIDDDWIDFEIHDGTHEFCKNDIALTDMIDYLRCKNK